MSSASAPFDDFENERRIRELAEQARQLRELGKQQRDWEQVRQLRKLAEEKLRLNEAFGPGFEIEKAIQRDQEALEQASSFRYLKALEEDARRDREWVRALEGALGSRHLKAIEDATLRNKNLLGATDSYYLSAVEEDARRQQKLVHSISRLSFPDFWSADRVLDANKFNSVASLHPVLEALQAMHLDDGLLRTLQRDEARQRMFQAALFAVDNAQGLGITAIDAASLSSKVAEALDSEGERSNNESPTDLLTFAIKLAEGISSLISDVTPKTVLKFVVLPLLLAFIPGSVFYELSSRENEQLVVRIEKDLARQIAPKRFIVIEEVSVRESGSKGAKLAGKLPAGSEVEVLDRTEAGWRYVRTTDASPRVEGWTYYRHLRPR